jgi:hypothetical protein
MKTRLEFSHIASRHSAAESEIVLGKDQLRTWSGNQSGLLIEAREGTLWLTQTGNSSDIILSRGQSFRITGPGQVIAQSLSPFSRLFTQPSS